MAPPPAAVPSPSEASTATASRLPLSPCAGAPLPGVLLVVIALAWLPGQDRAGALRLWITGGAGLLLVRPWFRRLGRRELALALPWGALLLFVLGSCASVAAPRAALRQALLVGAWLSGLLLGLGEGESGLRRLARWWSAAGALAAVPVLVGGGGGSFGNPDFAAAFLVGTLLGTLGSWRASAGWERHAATLSVVVQAAALVRSGSLGGLVGVGVAAFAWAWAVGWRRLRPATSRPDGDAVGSPDRDVRAGASAPPTRLRVLLVASAVAAALACAGLLSIPTVQEHLRGRLHLARVGWLAARRALPWGVGPGQAHGPLLEAQVDVLASRPAARRFHSNAYHAHNEPLQALVEGGPWALLLLLGPLALGLRWARPGPAWAAVLGYAVLGCVSLPLHMPGVGFVAALWLGAALARRDERIGAPAVHAAPAPPVPGDTALAGTGSQWSPAVLLLAPGLLLLGLASADLAGDRLVALGQAHGDADTFARAGTLLLHPSRAQQLEAEARIDLDPYAAYSLALSAARRNPSVQGWMLAGRAAAGGHSPYAALRCFHEAARLDPRLFAAQVNLSRTYEDLGRRVEARRHAAAARALRPSDPRLQWLPEP